VLGDAHPDLLALSRWFTASAPHVEHRFDH
jgi:hypothetical protein